MDNREGKRAGFNELDGKLFIEVSIEFHRFDPRNPPIILQKMVLKKNIGMISFGVTF